MTATHTGRQKHKDTQNQEQGQLPGSGLEPTFLPVVILLLHWVVVIPEEHYLEGQFGNEYRAYRTRVRRWL